MTTYPQHRQVRVVTSCTRAQVQEVRVRVGDSLAEGWVPGSCVEDIVEGS
jgi:hypothetical protein